MNSEEERNRKMIAKWQAQEDAMFEAMEADEQRQKDLEKITKPLKDVLEPVNKMNIMLQRICKKLEIDISDI